MHSFSAVFLYPDSLTKISVFAKVFAMKKSHFFLLALLFSFAFVSWAQAATIRIDSPKIELELEPGQVYSGEIIAENPTDEETKARIYLEDWIYTKGGTGEKTFTPPGTTPLTASPWITFSPAETTLQPFGRLTTRYTISVPKDAKGAHFSVLFFETILGQQTDDEGVNILVAGRIGALFLINIKGTTERKGEIKSIELQAPQGNKPLGITTTFENTGNTDIALSGNYLVMDSDGRIKARGDLNKIYTFPGSTESGKTEWVGRLPKGNYQVLLTYEVSKGQNLVEEKTLVVE
jgi:hypothetical protein